MKQDKYICYVEGKQVHIWAVSAVAARNAALESYIGTKRAPKITVYLSEIG